MRQAAAYRNKGRGCRYVRCWRTTSIYILKFANDCPIYQLGKAKTLMKLLRKSFKWSKFEDISRTTTGSWEAETGSGHKLGMMEAQYFVDRPAILPPVGYDRFSAYPREPGAHT